MSIPFTQFLMPDCRERRVEIDASAEVEALAHAHIRRGGWFEVEMLSDYRTVSLTACWDRPDGDDDVAIEVVQNGPEVPAAVERLVRRAAEYEP